LHTICGEASPGDDWEKGLRQHAETPVDGASRSLCEGARPGGLARLQARRGLARHPSKSGRARVRYFHRVTVQVCEVPVSDVPLLMVAEFQGYPLRIRRIKSIRMMNQLNQYPLINNPGKKPLAAKRSGCTSSAASPPNASKNMTSSRSHAVCSIMLRYRC
jgi:hypothetical protein